MRIYWKIRCIKLFVGILLLTMVFALSNDVMFAQAQHFTNCATNTGENATVLIPAASLLTHPDLHYTPQAGDEIAVFNPADNLCVGTLVWEGTNGALTVWGDNSLTPVIDGMVTGEEMQWRVWDSVGNREFRVSVQYDPTPPFHFNGTYATNRFYRLQEFQPTAVSLLRIQVSSPGVGWVGGIAALVFLSSVFALSYPASFRGKRNR